MATGIKSNKALRIKEWKSGRAANFSSSTILGSRTEGSGPSFVVIYGKYTPITALLHLIWLGASQPQCFSEPIWVTKASNGHILNDWMGCKTVCPPPPSPVSLSLWIYIFFLLPGKALQNTSLSEQVISCLRLPQTHFWKMCKDHFRRFRLTSKDLWRKLLCF